MPPTTDILQGGWVRRLSRRRRGPQE